MSLVDIESLTDSNNNRFEYDGTAIVSEIELRQLCKNLASLIPNDNGKVQRKTFNYRQLQSLLRALIRTASYPRLSVTHGAAACNALCGFLDQGVVSSLSELRALCFSPQVWTETFHMFLERSENTKAKPMKHVLVTLAKLLSKNSEASVLYALKDSTIFTLISIICEQDESESVKAAMQALEYFLTRRIVHGLDILLKKSQRITTENSLKIPNEINKEPQTSDDKPFSPFDWNKSTKGFVESVLRWLRYSDIAPISGRLLSSFFRSLQNWWPEDTHFKEPDVLLLLWMEPLKALLEMNPNLIEAVEHHVLPDLLRLDYSIFITFLNTLPMEDLRNGVIGKHGAANIQLCLLTVKIAKELKLIQNLAQDSAVIEGVYSFRVESLGLALLAHAVPGVRIAALSFTIYSSSSTEPLSAEALNSLQQNIPSFHTEVAAKTRNEFTSQVRKLCSRLRNILSSSGRNSRLFSDAIPSLSSIRDAESSKWFAEDPHLSCDLLQLHIDFMKWYIIFTFQELHPAASYQRHITALKILHLFIHADFSTFISRFTQNGDAKSLQDIIFNNHLVRLLLDLMMDPFDDVRSTAAVILKLTPQELLRSSAEPRQSQPQNDEDEIVEKYLALAYPLEMPHPLHRAETLMYRTGRADHADGVGRLYGLLYESSNRLDNWRGGRKSILEHILFALGQDIENALVDLRLAVKTTPLHGRLMALRYIVARPDFYCAFIESNDAQLDTWRSLNEQILQYCTKIWDAVKNVLCFDSPEGHMFEDDEDVDSDLGTKDVLSFSWRALKESSCLMHAMITNKAYGPPSVDEGLNYNDYKRLGKLSFTQLAELRHRGAFSTVSQTFAACCMRCAQADDLLVARLPQNWYQDTISCIQQKASALTRRSAGLPAMITGILTSYPTGTFFDSVILDLQAIAEAPVQNTVRFEDLRLPQVHALNCLKDVFTNTQLGSGTELHVADTLDIAAGCLETDTWAIRNCGLMLLKALLNRLHGGSHDVAETDAGYNRPNSKLVFEKFPNLPDLLFRLLSLPTTVADKQGQNGDSELASVQAQRLFPALEIIQRSGIPTQYEAAAKRLLRYHMCSRIWPVREKAAKTLSVLIDDKSINNEIKGLLSQEWLSQNALHGRLLCLDFILSRRQALYSDQTPNYFESFLPITFSSFEAMVMQNVCPFTIATYLRILVKLLGELMRRKSTMVEQYASRYKDQLLMKWKDLLEPSLSSNNLTNDPLLTLQAIALAKCLILINDLSTSKDTFRLFSLKQLRGLDHRVRDKILEAVGNSAEVNPIIRLRFLSETIANVGFESLGINEVMATCLADILKTSETADERQAYEILRSGDARFLQLVNWRTGGSKPNPRLSGADLHLRGLMLGEDRRLAAGNLKSDYEVELWTRMLELAGHERSDLQSRFAAVDSIKGFKYALRSHDSKARTSHSLLGVYLALYDTLDDDDEDIRDQGAALVSWILSDPILAGLSKDTGNLSLVPLAASRRLLGFLDKEYGKSQILWSHAVGKLIDAVPAPSPRSISCTATPEDQAQSSNSIGKHGETPTQQLRPVRVLLENARKEDSALFVEEKQNLYIDPVRQAEHWASVLTNLQPEAVDIDLERRLSTWVLEGLDALVETAESEVDGPLGWITKPEVFVLGIRVILAAKVVMHHARRRAVEIEEASCRRLLKRLSNVGSKILMHGLWSRFIEGVLEESI